ncbi:HU domain-containing protein [Hymenobacter chitinivorans]|uniref:SPOR domain-containing protein n=1 Tax=Hymenobacter chitinivorans DSM 11115 TaxID=1121954 RepID=A0A2M9BR46_9BACT|nr:hypothetical protein [Hymenobacter chitinivorans]PJJ60387.1 hypothetical protein CLV45_1813 [Hymenobacter chitinivorans DSM 11115]
MQLSDHIRTLLRDHDCVIIPDFGGLIADYAPAQVHPVRHTLAPPAKRVAFNQSLTRNDGLLVDALSRSLNLTTAQARLQVRDAVARLQAELDQSQRTELPGVGIFRQSAGRGLEFEYTGSQNLLTASYGLPELVSRPIRATDALLARDRQQSAPILAVSRSRRAMKTFRIAATLVITGLILSANYQFASQLGYLPESWKITSSEEQTAAQPAVVEEEQAAPVARQQAALAAHDWDDETPTTRAAEPAAPAAPAVAKPAVSKPKAVATKPVVKTPAATKPAVAVSVAKPAAVKPAVAAASAGTTIKSRTGRSYVIVGAYNTLAHAEKGRMALVNHGHRNARIVMPAPGSRKFRLSAIDYANKAEAQKQLPMLRKHLGSSLWVLNY